MGHRERRAAAAYQPALGVVHFEREFVSTAASGFIVAMTLNETAAHVRDHGDSGRPRLQEGEREFLINASRNQVER